MTVTNSADLAADIERRISSGELPPGHRLDPVRAAADALGLAPNTVANAYRRLGERGLVHSDGRRGTFVAERPAIGSPRFEEIPAALVNLAEGNPDPALLPDLAQAARAVAEEFGGPRRSGDVVLYGAPTVDERFAAAITPGLRGDLGPRLTTELEAGRDLAVVGGALDGIERTLQVHLRPGDLVAVEDPGYNAVFDLLRANSLRPEPVAIDGEGMQPEPLTRALERGAKAVVVTPRAQNPTGAALSDSRAAELREVLVTFPEVLIVEDDHAGPIAGSPYVGVVPDGHGSWALLRSVAKALGPDLRVAAVVGDPTTVARVVGRQALGVGWVSHLLQRIAAHLLTDPSTVEVLSYASNTYAQRRNVVVDGLTARGLTVSARSGLNVWVPVVDEAEVVAAAQQRGFALRSGARFRLEAAPAVRLSIAAQPVSVLEGATSVLAELLTSVGASRSV